MSENKTKKDETIEKISKKEEKMPNSLIVYIKTRLPNYYKMTYEPFMTVPKNKSHTLYFDPLVKYYEFPIKTLPPGAPKDALYTQFFEASEFDTMINRILSDFRYMQKPRTLQESVDQHIIDNNIKITLNNLFKTNNLFYVNKKPYTIIGSHWKDSDWQIDKKPIETLLTQFSNMTVKQLEEEAKKEEDDIPEVLRQGNISSSNLNNEETVTSVAEGLQKKVDNANTSKVVEEREIAGETDFFVHQDQLPGVSEDIKRLYSEYLRQNIPINYSDNPDLARDPLTLSLLVDPSELLKFINQNKKSSIVELYSSYITTKTDLQNSDKEYTDACTELAIYKTTFDLEVKNINETIKSEITSEEDIKTQKNKIIQQIILLKINYIKIIFRIADAIMEIYKKQNIYFVSVKLLLEGLKADYVNIIKYYEKPELAIKCIEYDISVINSLIELHPEDPYSESYFSNYEDFKKFYEKTLYANEANLLTPKINYKDEEYYFNDTGVLFIEKQQYEIYNFKMFLFYSYNQFSIWVTLFKSIQIFTKFVGNEAIQILQNSETDIKNYNRAFPGQQQQEFIDRIKADGLKSSYNKFSKTVNWFLVKEDGSRCIEPFKQVSKEKKPFKLMEDEMQERIYISSIKSQVQAYDAIVLYIYLLEVVCLRQNRVYVAEENVNQLNLEFSLTLNEYYHTIERSINEMQDKGKIVYIPSSLLWDVSNFTDLNFIEKRKKINDKSSIIYRGRLKSISKSRQEMIYSCEEIADIITPNLSESGFVSKCQTLLASNLNSINEHSFRSSYWLEKTIENYNNEGTSDFIYNMNYVVKDAWDDRITQDREPKEYLDWMVYDNSGTNTNDTIYASISDTLNGQLDLDGNETTNPYTEEIDNKRHFTINSLKNLVSEANNNLNISPKEIINILEEVLKIKFIVFEMFPRENTEIQLGDIVKYNGEKCRVVYIDVSTPEPLYTLYNGFNIDRDIPGAQVKLTKKNLNSNFRINCDFSDKTADQSYDENIYLVLSKQSNDTFFKYRLVKNSADNDFINQSIIIPIYIKYFIYNNCARFRDDKLAPSFGSFTPSFEYFTTKIENQIQSEQITQEIDNISSDLEKVESNYFTLKNMTNKTQEQQTQQTILKGEVKDLRKRLIQLQEILETPQNTLDRGGAVTKPSEQYVNYSNPYYGNPYYNPMNPMNPMNPNNIFYLPQGYKRPLPYNVSQNKSKDSKSKLSFYITIELELFPGKSANMFQKSVVKCQSTFERIREAYAEIRGFQYRPAPMSEAYSYGIQKDNKKNKSEKNIKKIQSNKTQSNNSSTRKLR
jgi:hypothetical protein